MTIFPRRARRREPQPARPHQPPMYRESPLAPPRSHHDTEPSPAPPLEAPRFVYAGAAAEEPATIPDLRPLTDAEATTGLLDRERRIRLAYLRAIGVLLLLAGLMVVIALALA